MGVRVQVGRRGITPAIPTTSTTAIAIAIAIATPTPIYPVTIIDLGRPPPGVAVAEVEVLVEMGVVQVTLVGQEVQSSG